MAGNLLHLASCQSGAPQEGSEGGEQKKGCLCSFIPFPWRGWYWSVCVCVWHEVVGWGEPREAWLLEGPCLLPSCCVVPTLKSQSHNALPPSTAPPPQKKVCSRLCHSLGGRQGEPGVSTEIRTPSQSTPAPQSALQENPLFQIRS